ncbi:hypothetical protein DPMN_114723 [Dreissena polymorpha]|uniref:Uncharacterized protein n=1 Tax=Dreissena polymorpha TaxID=45954 RepID=A0A9D4KKR7_DREPO|nr:hypothetical protein DPMN_114723 [Dreissena polymorpha]
MFHREAGLSCVLINGIAKRTEMDMSDPSGQVVNDTWTAVYVEADWQLVHPYWICRVRTTVEMRLLLVK